MILLGQSLEEVLVRAQPVLNIQTLLQSLSKLHLKLLKASLGLPQLSQQFLHAPHHPLVVKSLFTGATLDLKQLHALPE